MLIGIISVISAAAAAGLCFLTGAFQDLDWIWRLPVGFLGCFLLLAVSYFLFLWFVCAVVDEEKPQEKDSKFYRVITNLTAKTAMNIVLTKIHAEGLEKLPKDGRFLLVSNHIHDLDPVALMATFPKSQLAFISKRENNQKFLVGKLMHKILCQLINRENDREALKTILKCIQILKEDKASIAVFPEGYTSLDGLLHPFRSGVFKIAQKANVPIVVCTLKNTNRCFANALKLKRTHVYLHLLDVIPPEELKGVTAVEIGERIHTMMAEDLGPDLVLPEA